MLGNIAENTAGTDGVVSGYWFWFSHTIAAGHWFWFSMTIAAVAWYTFITGFVAVKGLLDIRKMLSNLKRLADETSEINGRQNG